MYIFKVRQLDWVERVWPPELKHIQDKAAVLEEEMFYPVVQKFVTMSAAGYFSDYRPMMAGAAAWIHVFDGELVSSSALSTIFL